MDELISVVVCHHTGTLLFGFLDSLFKSQNIKFEVIILTSNEELALKGIKNCLVIHDTNSPAYKRNAGVRVARGKYIAFFDDDVTIDPLCLYHLKESLGPSIGMTYGRLWNMEHRNRFDEAGSYLTRTGFLWSRAGQNDIDNGQYSREEYVLSGKSASCMARKDILQKVGGFDEDFGILGEETDLSWRIWLYGKYILYVPQATGFHAFNTKFKPKEKHYTNKRVFYNGSRNYITMLLKNLEACNLWRILPLHLTIWFFAGLAMIITLKVAEGWNIWCGIWYVVRNCRLISQKRAKIQQKRVKSDDELWENIYRKAPRGYYIGRFLRYVRTALHG
jgi:GT2 family glycosyltransferase